MDELTSFTPGAEGASLARGYLGKSGSTGRGKRQIAVRQLARSVNF